MNDSQHSPLLMVTHWCAMTLWLLATSVVTVYHTFALIWLDVFTSHVYTNHYVNSASLQNWKRAREWKCVQCSRANWPGPDIRRQFVCGGWGGRCALVRTCSCFISAEPCASPACTADTVNWTLYATGRHFDFPPAHDYNSIIMSVFPALLHGKELLIVNLLW